VSPPPVIADPNDLLGTYSFLPWLRQGIANAITAPPSGLRAEIRVDLKLVGTPLAQATPSPNRLVRTSSFTVRETWSASTGER